MQARMILPALAVLLALGGCQSASVRMKRVATTQDNHRAAIERGVAFLLSQQRRNGAFGHDPAGVIQQYELYMGTVASYDGFTAACTALSCMAMMEAQDLKLDCAEPLRQGLQYLLTCEQPRRGTSDEMYCVWAHCFATQALARAILRGDTGVERAALEAGALRWIDSLARQQYMDGGWGYYEFNFGTQHPTGRQTTSFTTGAVLNALYEAKQAGLAVPDRMQRLPLKSLEAMRKPDGSFIYGLGGTLRPMSMSGRIKGSLGRSQGPTLALYRYGRGLDVDDLTRVLDRLIEHHHFLEIARGRPIPHETWYANAGYYYFFGHFYASEVVKELPADLQPQYWRHLTQWMLNAQQQDGSWWDWKFTGYQKIYATSFALMTLINSYKGTHAQ